MQEITHMYDTCVTFFSLFPITSEQVESLQSELDHTKAQAHWMLFNQGSEINDASAALAELCQGISSAVAKMSDQAVIKVSNS